MCATTTMVSASGKFLSRVLCFKCYVPSDLEYSVPSTWLVDIVNSQHGEVCSQTIAVVSYLRMRLCVLMGT